MSKEQEFLSITTIIVIPVTFWTRRKEPQKGKIQPSKMKIHTSRMMSMGRGDLQSASNKQKMNTKRSTEAELVGVDELMPQILWMRYFLGAQGMKVYDNVVYQDNQSAMKLKKNGRASSGKRTSHITIRYYFVTDRIQAN